MSMPGFLTSPPLHLQFSYNVMSPRLVRTTHEENNQSVVNCHNFEYSSPVPWMLTTLGFVNSAELTAAFAQHQSVFERLDICINNAGVAEKGQFYEETMDWRRVMDINLTAVIEGTKLAVHKRSSSLFTIGYECTYQFHGRIKLMALMAFDMLSARSPSSEPVGMFFCTGASNERPRRSDSECWLCSWVVSHAIRASIHGLQRFVQAQSAPSSAHFQFLVSFPVCLDSQSLLVSSFSVSLVYSSCVIQVAS
jgi:NAD(P)-dependent dehydrogenase (short-subunit alcohol dehydrogenase family)